MLDKQTVHRILVERDACWDGMKIFEACTTLQEAYHQVDFLHLVWLADQCNLQSELRVLALRVIRELKLPNGQTLFDEIESEAVKQVIVSKRFQQLPIETRRALWELKVKPRALNSAKYAICALFLYSSGFLVLADMMDYVQIPFYAVDNPALYERARNDLHQLFSEVIPFERLMIEMEKLTRE